jgi:hypothetical protein
MRVPLALAASALVIGAVAIHDPARGAPFGSFRVFVTGTPQMVFDKSRDACDRNDIPDSTARAFRDSTGQVVLIASHYTVRRMIGPSLDRLHHPCSVVMRSGYSADPARFDDREWIGATHTRDGRRVYALVHDEYHGNKHRGRCRSHSYRRCWYNAVTLAVSTNGGRSFRHARPPRQFVAGIPYRYREGSRPRGVFAPSNIVYRPSDRHYYAFVHVEGYGGLGSSGSCLIRTTRLSNPRSWRAWDGTGFGYRFVNPYTRRIALPSRNICRPVAPGAIAAMSDSLTYNTYLKAYVLVGISGDLDRTTNRVVWGVYFSASPDLVHWSRRKLVMAAEVPWTFKCGDSQPILYPSVLDPHSRARNFGTSGQTAYLYFTRWNRPTSCRPTMNRDLVRVPIAFQR